MNILIYYLTVNRKITVQHNKNNSKTEMNVQLNAITVLH